ncbi:GerAB/ArcD/ProY family transporter [Halobacillus sp. K22]|uniref:GerAB/ArcD/ProY family transporter n=1 Tax=Halobacillus sp. K22 TaxID=3457431 RepID=UPI003FCD1A22
MNIQLTKYQLFTVTTNFVIFSSILMAPALTVTAAKQDGWISMLFAFIIGLLLNLVYVLILKKHQYPSLFSLIDRAAGKWIGTLLNLVVMFYALHLAAMVVRNLSNFIVSSVFPNAHPWIYQILVISIVAFTAFYGVRNLFLINELLSPLLFLIVGTSLILIIKDFSFIEIKPVFHSSFQSIFEGAYATLGFPFIEALIIGNFFHYVQQKKQLMFVYLSGISLGGITLVIAVLLIIGNDGAYMVARETYPTYSVLRDIEFTTIFERIEILIALAWITGLFFKITVCFLVVMMGFKHLSNSKSYRPFIIPIAILTWAMTNHLHKTVMDFSNFVTSSWTLYWFTLYSVLMMVFLIGFLRQKKQSGQDQLP